MGKNRILPKPLLTKDTFQYDKKKHDLVDPLFPKSQRLQKWLAHAAVSPIRVDWEGYPKFDKDLRELVAKGALELKRRTICDFPPRRMTELHITAKGRKMLK